MSLSHDLLFQAQLLAKHDKRRPKQANLRRAISAAYYALFHLLIEEASQTLAGSRVSGLAARVGRTLTHADIRKACLVIAQPLQSPLRELLGGTVSSDLLYVAERFVKLQELRHSADYDIDAWFTKVETLALIGNTQAAFNAWHRIRSSEEANIFLLSLAFGTRWAK